MRVLVTGAAGFIGSHLAKKLLEKEYTVIGIDNLNNYYDVKLKRDRLEFLNNYKNFFFIRADLEESNEMERIFFTYNPSIVVNLAAQAGVRYSLTNPKAYIDSNIRGFLNILEECKKNNVKHLIYASSSSVYGANKKIPFSTKDNVDHPVSLYAATKKTNELMAHTYSHLYGIPTTGLRFFTVYGPWGRPDMAYYSFTRNIIEGNPIKVFNYGKMKRDFTYIDDIVEGIMRLLDKAPTPNPNWNGENPDPSSSYAPYKIYNIGNNQPVGLIEFINTLEDLLGKKAKLELLPMQPGDVKATYADILDLQRDIDFKPQTSLKEGLKNFVEWYISYHNLD
jgi:UDP-glucuronate 4-epimerase